jgi:hypothetical protein
VRVEHVDLRLPHVEDEVVAPAPRILGAELDPAALDGDELAPAVGEQILAVMAATGAEPVAVRVGTGQGEDVAASEIGGLGIRGHEDREEDEDDADEEERGAAEGQGQLV